ncbi:MAG TPA: flagellar hook-basal body protein [Candidatus Deferrimicrobiaceae bacterium]
MQAGMYIAYTGARAAEKRLEQVANNLANISSVGYKQDKSIDSGVVPAASLAGIDPSAASGAMPGGQLLYSTPAMQYVDMNAGPLRTTGKPTDLAIEGEGFFTVRTKDGDRLTRAGNFRIDAAGDLATVDGGKVLGAGGPIHIGDGVPAVTSDGQVAVDGNVVGTLLVQKVPDPTVLKKEGHSLFLVPPGTALSPAGAGARIEQGSVEEANVSAITGMTEMVEASRMFDAYMKMMSTISDLNSKASNDLGRV